MACLYPLDLVVVPQLLLMSFRIGEVLEGGDAFGKDGFSDVELGGKTNGDDVLAGEFGVGSNAIETFLHERGDANRKHDHLVVGAAWEGFSRHRRGRVVAEILPMSLSSAQQNASMCMQDELGGRGR
jgi:hypothetical protein